MFYCIDRIEDGKAVLLDEAENEMLLSTELLTKGAKEGDWGVLDTAGCFVPNISETDRRRAQINELLSELLNR